jgi:hypothetical protein
MSHARVSLLLLSLLTVAPAAAVAQKAQPKQFENSWFWGAKGGGLMYSTTLVSNSIAPSAGGEWLITRTRGALYVAFDQAFFTNSTTVADPYSVTGLHDVELTNVRRLTLALMAFPKNFGGVRPYGGLGFAVHLVGTATPAATYSSGAEESSVMSSVQDTRSQASPIVIAGVQTGSPSVGLFAQVSAAPVRGFLLSGSSLYSAEAGIRLNMGSAIDRIR